MLVNNIAISGKDKNKKKEYIEVFQYKYIIQEEYVRFKKSVIRFF